MLRVTHFSEILRTAHRPSSSFLHPWSIISSHFVIISYHPLSPGLQRHTINAVKPYGLSLNETTIANKLKTQGYQNHIVGKVSMMHGRQRSGWLFPKTGIFSQYFTPVFHPFIPACKIESACACTHVLKEYYDIFSSSHLNRLLS